MRTQFFMSEVGLGLRRNLTMTVASIVVVTVTVTLLGVALMVRGGTARTKHNLLSNIEVSVYLENECGTAGAGSNCLTPEERTQIQQTLESLPQVADITYISKTDAYQRFKEEFAGSPELVKNATPSAIPESFAVKLKDPRQFAIIDSAVSQAPGVQSVTDAEHDLNRIFDFLHRITLAVLVFALLLLVATCLLIYNAMRVAAFTRRRETGIMRLVGASDLSIQAPFILEGAVIGVVGSGFAILLLVAVREFFHTELRTQLLVTFGEWATLFSALPWVIAIGVLLPAVASFVTLQRHLRV